MKRIVMLLLVMVAAPIRAEPCFEIEDADARLACYDATRVCAGVGNDRERLACFDRAYGAWDRATADRSEKKQNKQSKQKEDPPGAKTRLKKRKVEAEDFGRLAPAEEVSYIESSIAEVQTRTDGIDYLRLENGQVWRENTDARVRYRKGQAVSIEQGALNSFNLRVGNVRKLIKVRRVE